MQPFAGSEPFIEGLGRIILCCAERGEALVLLGCEEDWRAQRTFFECHCGQKLTLTNRRDGAVLMTYDNGGRAHSQGATAKPRVPRHLIN